MNPFQIVINNTPIQLGASLPKTITSLKIVCLIPITIPKSQSPLVKRWLNTIVESLDCEYIEYNGTLVNVSDIKLFEL